MQIAKRALRKDVLAKRRGLSAESLRLESIKITNFLCSWAVFTKAQTIMIFLSMPDEAQTSELIKAALAAGKKVCVPLIGEQRGQMQAVWLKDLNDLVVGKYGIQTVAKDKIEIVEPAEFDLILVPGVAFDTAGRRCGMGAGYYDRFLVNAQKAILAGICLSCQLVANVPCAEYDQSVHFLVTANGVLDCLSLHST